MPLNGCTIFIDVEWGGANGCGMSVLAGGSGCGRGIVDGKWVWYESTGRKWVWNESAGRKWVWCARVGMN